MVTHDPKAAGRARRLVRLEKGILIEDNNKNDHDWANIGEQNDLSAGG
jgi:hypothetical protein